MLLFMPLCLKNKQRLKLSSIQTKCLMLKYQQGQVFSPTMIIKLIFVQYKKSIVENMFFSLIIIIIISVKKFL